VYLSYSKVPGAVLPVIHRNQKGPEEEKRFQVDLNPCLKLYANQKPNLIVLHVG
jgi:hypothetical protein